MAQRYGASFKNPWAAVDKRSGRETPQAYGSFTAFASSYTRAGPIGFGNLHGHD
jgi:hypothetical protein